MLDKSDTMRTEVRRVRYLGSARSGTTALWHMRLTSLALVPLTIAFVLLVLDLVGRPYGEVRTILAAPFPALLMLLFIVTGIYHMQLGMRAIIEDYVHEDKLKDLCLAANLFFAAVVGLTCVYAICKLSFA